MLSRLCFVHKAVVLASRHRQLHQLELAPIRSIDLVAPGAILGDVVLDSVARLSIAMVVVIPVMQNGAFSGEVVMAARAAAPDLPSSWRRRASWRRRQLHQIE